MANKHKRKERTERKGREKKEMEKCKQINRDANIVN